MFSSGWHSVRVLLKKIKERSQRPLIGRQHASGLPNLLVGGKGRRAGGAGGKLAANPRRIPGIGYLDGKVVLNPAGPGSAAWMTSRATWDWWTGGYIGSTAPRS